MSWIVGEVRHDRFQCPYNFCLVAFLVKGNLVNKLYFCSPLLLITNVDGFPLSLDVEASATCSLFQKPITEGFFSLLCILLWCFFPCAWLFREGSPMLDKENVFLQSLHLAFVLSESEKLNHIFHINIHFIKKNYHLMRTIQLKTAMAFEWSCDLLRPIRVFHLFTSHVTLQGKQTLTNRKLCNFTHIFLPVWCNIMTSQP